MRRSIVFVSLWLILLAEKDLILLSWLALADDCYLLSEWAELLMTPSAWATNARLPEQCGRMVHYDACDPFFVIQVKH
jgi:hypothetical protein